MWWEKSGNCCIQYSMDQEKPAEKLSTEIHTDCSLEWNTRAKSQTERVGGEIRGREMSHLDMNMETEHPTPGAVFSERGSWRRR